jgi:hypothetical protein
MSMHLWIDASTQLPESGDAVLCFIQHMDEAGEDIENSTSYEVGWIDRATLDDPTDPSLPGWLDSTGQSIHGYGRVTHYHPLPAAPEGGR